MASHMHGKKWNESINFIVSKGGHISRPPAFNEVQNIRVVSSSSSTGTATLVGYGLLNYRWVFSAGFYRMPLPAARQTPNLVDEWLERSNFRYQVSLTSETTRANPSSGSWNYGREIAENFAESGDFHVTFGFFYMP